MINQLHTVAQFQGRKTHCYLFLEVFADPEGHAQSFQLLSDEIVTDLKGRLVEGGVYWIERTPSYFECIEEVLQEENNEATNGC